MKQIMSVEDSFSTKGAGIVVSGVNPEYDSMDPSEIKKLIGERIRIVRPNGQELAVNVRDIAISESIVGKKNISIAIGEIAGISEIESESKIYSIE